MRAVFHIGRPKVGSTSIQRFLYANTRSLARQGVLHHRLHPNFTSQWEWPIAALTECNASVPDSRMRTFLQIKDHASQQRYTKTMMAKFEANLSKRGAGKQVFVASSEHAVPYLRTPAEVAQFDTVLRRYFDDVTYVLYIRDQVSLCVSAYSEKLKRGGTKSFDRYLETAQRENRFDHARVIAPWVDALGTAPLKVRILERDDLVGGDLIDDFCEAAGIDPSGMERPEPANPSLTRDAAEVTRVMNGFLPVLLDDGRPNPLRRDLLARLLDCYGDTAPLRMSLQQESRVRADYAAGNQTVRQMFFPDRDTLFTPRPGFDAAPQATTIDHDAALQMALSLLVAVRQGQIAPLSRRALRRAVSLDPHTATKPGAAPIRASLADRWPFFKSPRFRQLNPLNRG